MQIEAPPAGVEHAAERIAQEVGIPPCPAILARFSAEMLAAEPDLRKLSGLIGSDAALSAAMLKTVNSAFFGLDSKAASVQQALSILGLRASANLITGLLLKHAFPGGEGPLMRQFWDSTAALALIAGRIAERLQGVNADEAHTYVLFRDCGQALMIRRYPVYAGILEAHAGKAGRHLVAVENERFRFCHARVGSSLAREWLLPEPMCNAILHHHAPQAAASLREQTPADLKLMAFGLLAEQIVALGRGRGLCPDWSENEAFVLETLDIDADAIVALADELAPQRAAA